MARMIRTNVGPLRVTVTRQAMAGHPHGNLWSVVQASAARQYGWEAGQTDALGMALATAIALNH